MQALKKAKQFEVRKVQRRLVAAKQQTPGEQHGVAGAVAWAVVLSFSMGDDAIPAACPSLLDTFISSMTGRWGHPRPFMHPLLILHLLILLWCVPTAAGDAALVSKLGGQVEATKRLCLEHLAAQVGRGGWWYWWR